MRRLALLTSLAVALAGCSGLGKFESDTLTLPGANPNKPAGASETMLRVENHPFEAPALAPEPGNVWPGRPKPFPTLGEVERETQQAGQTQGGAGAGGGGAGGGATGQAPGQNGTAPGSPNTGAGTSTGPNSSSNGSKFEMKASPNSASTIVIPNGNGTSTVIAPDGSVRVIPTPKNTGPVQGGP